MSYKIKGKFTLPEYTGTRVLMMPFIQGDSDSIPDELSLYKPFVEAHYLDAGKTGYLTIDERFVEAGQAQRGYGNSNRTLHTEACAMSTWITWKTPVQLSWGSSWGKDTNVYLESDLRVIIGNSIDNSCAVWNAEEIPTIDGDLGHVADKYPRNTGYMMPSGQLVEIGIRTPHECIPQDQSSERQFVRIVGDGVHGRAPHFTENPLLAYPHYG